MRHLLVLRFVSACLATVLSLGSILVQPVRAELITTDALLASNGADARARLLQLVQREDVAAELVKYGISPEEAGRRLAALSDEEIAAFSDVVGEVPAGADSGLGTVIGAVVFLFVLLLITDIIGFTKVFPFTRSIR